MVKKMHVAARVGRWSALHPWRAILIWLTLTVITAAVGVVVAPQQATDLDLQVGESASATRLADDAGLRDPATESILIQSDQGKVNDEARGAAKALRATLQDVSEVTSVAPPVPSGDGKALLLQVVLKGDVDSAGDHVAPITDATEAAGRAHPGLRVEETGAASIHNEFDEWIGQDLGRVSKISLPVTLVILLLIFGALVMAGVPLLLGLSAVASALGMWALASHVVPDPGPVADVIGLMGLAVGVDYCLFYLRRYREECARGYDATSAVNIAAATSGHSVVVSGIAVLFSVSGLYFSGDVMLSALATGAILVVAVAMVSAVTVLPAMLVKLGRAVDRPRVPLIGRLSRGHGSPRVWNALLRPATRHPFVSLALACVALLALASPALHMKLKATEVSDFPRTLATMQTYDRVLEKFPDTANTDVVVVHLPGGDAGRLRERMTRLAEAVRSDSHFAGEAAPAIRYAKDRRTAVLEAATSTTAGTPEARESVNRLRQALVPEAMEGLSGAEYAVGGDQAEDMDYTANLQDSLPLVVGVVFALTFLIIVFAFRSVMVALTTVLLNLLSVMASLGFLCLVFQNTWAEGILGFTSTGHVVSWVPLLLFVILSGLSLDYHVFVVSRIREGVIAGMKTREAVRDGITRTAGVVTGAAAVMVVVFATFGTLDFIELKQIGVGLAVAVFLDATVVRIIVLPAVMTLLGRANWWPSTTGRRTAAQDLPRSERPQTESVRV